MGGTTREKVVPEYSGVLKSTRKVLKEVTVPTCDPSKDSSGPDKARSTQLQTGSGHSTVSRQQANTARAERRWIEPHDRLQLEDHSVHWIRQNLTRQLDVEIARDVLQVWLGHGDATGGGVRLTDAVDAVHAQRAMQLFLLLQREDDLAERATHPSPLQYEPCEEQEIKHQRTSTSPQKRAGSEI